MISTYYTFFAVFDSSPEQNVYSAGQACGRILLRGCNFFNFFFRKQAAEAICF
jgi:hypothetical protein